MGRLNFDYNKKVVNLPMITFNSSKELFSNFLKYKSKENFANQIPCLSLKLILWKFSKLFKNIDIWS